MTFLENNKLLFIVNTFAGKGIKDKKIQKITEIFTQKGWDVTVYKTKGRNDATLKAEKDAQSFDRIVCMGGDGTLNEVICGIMKQSKNIPVGYIPAGSANDLGSSIGLPKNNIKAAKRVANGKIRQHDIASFETNGETKTFVYIASFGAFTELSWSTPQKVKKVLGHSAYVLGGVKSFFNIKGTHVHIKTDLHEFDGHYIFCAAANTLRVGGMYKFTQTEVNMSDGLLEIVLIHRPEKTYFVPRLINRLLFHRFNNVDITFIHTKSAEFTFPDGNAPIWTLDGECAPSVDSVKINCIHGKINLIY